MTKQPGGVQAGPSVKDLLQKGAAFLREAGIAEPKLEAEVLLRYVTSWDRTTLFAKLRDPVNEEELLACYQDCLAVRAEGCPIAYVTGEREFWSLGFEVDRRVLIPRPETELVVETALDLLKEDREARVADVGTGSGNIACSLAHERKDWRIAATDASPAALELARSNASRLGVAGRIDFVACDLLAGLAGRFDLIVSNPPYVADGEELPRDVRDFEPRAALFAGPAGTEVIERLVREAPGRLEAGGAMAFEVGKGQATRALKLLLASGSWEDAGVSADIAGIDRVVWARGWRI